MSIHSDTQTRSRVLSVGRSAKVRCEVDTKKKTATINVVPEMSSRTIPIADVKDLIEATSQLREWAVVQIKELGLDIPVESSLDNPLPGKAVPADDDDDDDEDDDLEEEDDE